MFKTVRIALSLAVACLLVLAIGGGLLTWGGNFAAGMVHDQLAAQKISFPAKGAPSFDPKRQLVQHLANKIAYGINRAITITPVGLVAAALLSHVRRGISAAEVESRVELLRFIAAEQEARFGVDLAGASSSPLEPGPIGEAMAALVLDGWVKAET